MKINQDKQMMTLVLILLLSSTFLHKLEHVNETKQVPSSKDAHASSTPKQNLNVQSAKNTNKIQIEIQAEKSRVKSEEKLQQTGAKLINKETPFMTFNKLTIKDLTRYTIDCTEPNTGINSFSLTKRMNTLGAEELGYKYTCVNSPSVKLNCVQKSTIMSQIVNRDYSLGALVKIYPQCASGFVLSK